MVSGPPGSGKTLVAYIRCRAFSPGCSSKRPRIYSVADKLPAAEPLIRLARPIPGLAGEAKIQTPHIAGAIQDRPRQQIQMSRSFA